MTAVAAAEEEEEVCVSHSPSRLWLRYASANGSFRSAPSPSAESTPTLSAEQDPQNTPHRLLHSFPHLSSLKERTCRFINVGMKSKSSSPATALSVKMPLSVVTTSAFDKINQREGSFACSSRPRLPKHLVLEKATLATVVVRSAIASLGRSFIGSWHTPDTHTHTAHPPASFKYSRLLLVSVAVGVSAPTRLLSSIFPVQMQSCPRATTDHHDVDYCNRWHFDHADYGPRI